STLSINDNDANFEDNDASQTLNGAQSFGGTAYAGGTRVEAEYTLTLRDPGGNIYTVIGLNINGATPGATYATIEGLAFIGPVGGCPPVGVPLPVTRTGEGPTGGTTPYTGYATPACFTPGTLIDTVEGARDIDSLQIGDWVLTLDHG